MYCKWCLHQWKINRLNQMQNLRNTISINLHKNKYIKFNIPLVFPWGVPVPSSPYQGLTKLNLEPFLSLRWRPVWMGDTAGWQHLGVWTNYHIIRKWHIFRTQIISSFMRNLQIILNLKYTYGRRYSPWNLWVLKREYAVKDREIHKNDNTACIP